MAVISAAAAVVSIGSSIAGAVSSNKAKQQAANAQSQAVTAQTDATNQQLQLAKDQWNRYQNTYGPLEDEMVQESRNYGSEANKDKAALGAAGDVTSSYNNLRSQLNSTPGLDPSSQKYLDTTAKIGVNEAAQSAAAQTGARQTVAAQGVALEQGAAGLGKGIPGSATQALGGATVGASQLGNLASMQNTNANNTAAGVGSMVAGTLTNPANSGLFNKIGGLFSTPSASAGTVPGGFNADGSAFNNISAYVPG